jgi:tetratricopeptide (TPR) repeat protein
LADLAAFLERGWSGLTGAVGASRPRAAATLFRKADRLRNEGRYNEAARLVAQGLEQTPESSVGHLLSAYLYAAAREMDLARAEFERVLALDPYHARALLGLARLDIEAQDLEGATELLDRALRFYSGFPEAEALREMVTSGAVQSSSKGNHASTVTLSDLEVTSSAHDLVMARADGTIVTSGLDEERSQAIAQHLGQVSRMASAAMARAGLGALRRAVIETESETTFVMKHGAASLCVTLEGHGEIGSGLAQVGRLWTKLEGRD